MTSLSLRSRLLLWAGATTAFTLVLVIVLVDVSFRSNIREQVQESLTFARQVAEGTRQNQLDVRISETINVAEDARLRAAVATGDRATVSESLNEVFPARAGAWAAVVLPDGSLLAGTSGVPAGRLAVADDLLEEARFFDTGDLWIADGALVDVAASAILFGNDALAVLVTGQPTVMAEVTTLETAIGRPTAAVYDERMVPGAQAAALSDESRAQLIAWDVTAHEGVELLELEDGQYFATALPLLAASGNRLGSVVLLASYDEALRPSNALRVTLIAILVFGLGLAFAVSGVLARAITVPVGRLLRETERLAEGDLAHPIVPLRHDEIGRLADSFEHMRVSLNVARSELIRAERLSAIGKAASAVAHDFTQPLSAIAGAIGLLRMESTTSDVRERCFGAIEGELARLQRMKQEIVEFARGESSLDEANVRIDSFLENTVSALKGELAKRGIKLTVHHGHSGEWYIDSYRLERVIENLVRNAAAAISGEGSIVIRSSVHGGDLVLEVEDDGSGIPPEILEDVFEPFVSHGKKEGTGLGLAIARNVVQQHHGTIDVESSPSGTRFTITLPRRSGPTAPAHQNEGAS